MSIKHQPKSDKHPYASPTTPGLYVAFRDFIIELVCLNVNPKIGPRFWSDRKYWGPKYGREIRGMFNLSGELDLENTLVQVALIKVIKTNYIKALVSKKTVVRVVRLTHKCHRELLDQRESLSKKKQPAIIDSKKNATFVDTGKRNVLAKIRDAENG